jgi:hypothetical protein
MPDHHVNRVDFSIMLNNSLGKKPMNYSVAFRDVRQGDYFSGHVLSLNRYGITDIKAPIQNNQNVSTAIVLFMDKFNGGF